MPAIPVADARAGVDMLYSSGTTGRPNGVRVPLPEDPAIDAANSLVMLASAVFQINADRIHLSPAPHYHAAPFRWSITIPRLGVTAVLIQQFDPAAALAPLATFARTSLQCEPTHVLTTPHFPPHSPPRTTT